MPARNGWYARLFALIYDPFMHSIEKQILSHHRRQMIGELRGRIVEIGAGSGANFHYYNAPAVQEILAIEPNVHLWNRAEAKLRSLASALSVRNLRAGVSDESIASAIVSGSMDAIVCTLVLCTVPDPERVIGDAIRWLKIGGQLIILEHIRSHTRWVAFFQDLLGPAWKIAADGCCLNRRTDLVLKRSGLDLKEELYFRKLLPFYRAIYVKTR